MLAYRRSSENPLVAIHLVDLSETVHSFGLLPKDLLLNLAQLILREFSRVVVVLRGPIVQAVPPSAQDAVPHVVNGQLFLIFETFFAILFLVLSLFRWLGGIRLGDRFFLFGLGRVWFKQIVISLLIEAGHLIIDSGRLMNWRRRCLLHLGDLWSVIIRVYVLVSLFLKAMISHKIIMENGINTTNTVISLEDFTHLRNTSANNYKKLCQSMLKVRDPKVLLKAAICILRMPPPERQEWEHAVLEKATSELEFFKQLGDEKAHQRCCRLMTYRQYAKNEIVFKEGDPSTEFFIIIDGSANVYKARPPEDIEQEVAKEKHQLRQLSTAEREKHPSHIIENYQAPRQLMRRVTITFAPEDFIHVNHVLKPLPKLQSQPSMRFSKKETQSSDDLELIRQITHGLEKIPDKQFLFQGGVFLHDLVAQLQDGHMFGERGIMIESKRTGTVITTSPLHVAVLTKAEYKALLEDNELDKIRKKTKLLSKTFLKNLSYKETIEKQYLFEKRKYPMGHMLYREGDVPDMVYIIIKGTVKVFRRKNRLFVPLYELGSEQVVGEAEFFEKKERGCNVQVTSNKFSCYVISYADLSKIFNQHPQCEQLVLFQHQQRQAIDNQRVIEQAKAQRKLSQLEISPVNQNQERIQPRIYDPNQRPRQSISMMEFIKTTGQQLKQMRAQQKEEIRKELKQTKDQKSLAETLIQLERQTQQFRKEIRRQEQMRFSCLHIGDSVEKSSSLSSYHNKPRYSSLTEQMLFNYKSQQYQEPVEQTPITTPQSSQNILISSKHNLFRAKPKKAFLMFQYERKTPKAAQDISLIRTPSIKL